MNTEDRDKTGPRWDSIESTDDINIELASAVVSLVDWLEKTETERTRILDNRILEDLYGGRWVNSDNLALGVAAYGQSGGEPVKLNFARNAVDFVHTKICAETPAVVVSSRSSDYSSEQRADQLSKIVDTMIDSCKLMSLGPVAALAALRTGVGIVKTFHMDGRPMAEVVPSSWVHVDPIEGMNGNPSSIYEKRPVPRESVRRQWSPDGYDDDISLAISAAGPSTDPLEILSSFSSESAADNIDVYEAWTLGSDEYPGRHVICIQGATLLDEEWVVDRFPHAFYGIDVPPPGRGFWAQGLLCQVDQVQAEIDFLLAQVSEQIRMGRLKVFVQNGSGVSEDRLASSRQGEIVHYEGARPDFITPPTVGREALEHIQWLVTELYQTIGMSEQASSSQRPAGVNSGRAILFFHDFQTKRFVDLVKRYGEFIIQIVERLIDRIDDMHRADIDISSDDDIDWAKLKIDRNHFRLKLETVSSVPRTYAGRVQRIEQLIATGQIPQQYWVDYLSDPNAWKAEHRASAQAEYIDWLIGVLSDSSKDVPNVNDHMDLDMAIEIFNGEILRLERRGADQEIIDRFEEMFDSITARRDELIAAQAPPQGAPAPVDTPQLPNGGIRPGEQ